MVDEKTTRHEGEQDAVPSLFRSSKLFKHGAIPGYQVGEDNLMFSAHGNGVQEWTVISLLVPWIRRESIAGPAQYV